MRRTCAALLVTVLATGLGFPLHVHAAVDEDPPLPDCGEGRTWWPPVESCVTPPAIKDQVQPDYGDAPEGLDYGALLYLHVSGQGTVSDVQIVKAPLEGQETPQGEAALSALVRAMRRWTFEPGHDGVGRPVSMTVLLKVRLRT
jgi:hypothetical protein